LPKETLQTYSSDAPAGFVVHVERGERDRIISVLE
jgi:hypothetical protein